ncbi:DUF3040 domain-containing protein [Solicola sp. PLA-1-18]|uniref:DUF3040 domain-containing protein n=1 Tax=Solicola sp. PLA-1-18 TaxID=3380532 RepID=UPI003B7E8B1F
MPLSEEEQRLLDQLEQALAADDPSLASALRGSKLRARNRRRAIVAVLAFLGGVALLMVGVISTITVVGVVGFVVMLGATYVFLNAWRSGLGMDDGDDEHPQEGVTPIHRPAASRQPRQQRQRQRRPSQPGQSFMDRMEERWKRRRDDDQR